MPVTQRTAPVYGFLNVPTFQTEQPGQFAGHESRVNARGQIVPGHLAAKRPEQGAQEMRESRPPRFAKAHDSILSEHSADPHQTLIREMVQNQNADERLPGTAREHFQQVSLPPGNRPWQFGRLWREIQTRHRRPGKPARNLPAQMPGLPRRVRRSGRRGRETRGFPCLADGAAQRSSHPATVAHQGIYRQQIKPPPQGRGVISRQVIEHLRANDSAYCHMPASRIK